jgi:hypothetical protein
MWEQAQQVLVSLLVPHVQAQRLYLRLAALLLVQVPVQLQVQKVAQVQGEPQVQEHQPKDQAWQK